MKKLSKKSNKKGFTLMELLIVVAIIAILIAIAIPVFSGQLNKAKVAADEANVRSWYAEQQVSALTEDKYSYPSSYTGPSLQAPSAAATPNGSSGNFTVTYSGNGSTVTFGASH
jgi:type IV pilus assembly protein PilA